MFTGNNTKKNQLFHLYGSKSSHFEKKLNPLFKSTLAIFEWDL